ncbi:DUF6541 family protein [Arthrobacter oryzae]|uniref:Uncharacterized protein n=1 Tax=Arthrobacter oryzae TaxID=409290 RepID=A0A3N0C3E8_9MICC|nr:DUF6541 family protein [Arthrobacter oryzae]RNL57094.1 hypothetical protein D7003_07925 [Arthrobacter oryzae]
MWWSFLPHILGAVALLILPGLMVSLALRFRGFEALALAPAFSVGIIVLASTAAPLVGLGFGLLPTAATALVLAAVAAWAARSRSVPAPPASAAQPTHASPPVSGSAPWWRRDAAAFAAVLIAGLLLAVRVLQATGTPDAFSQTYDAVFHLNSVRFALDTGQSSSLTLGGMTGGGFYPAGWNAVATLVAATTGTGVPVAVNITTLVLAAVFWPLSVVLLAKWAVGARPAGILGAGIAAASLGAFPLLMMDFGVLYPNLLAISVLPASIALAASLAGFAPGRTPHGPGLAPRGPGLAPHGPADVLPTVLALLLALSGLVVAHPTTFMAWLTWTLPMAAILSWRAIAHAWRGRQTEPRRLRLRVLGAAGYAAVFLTLWIVLRPPADAAFWGPNGTAPQALGEALSFSPVDLSPAWLVAPLALLGLWACFQAPRRFAWIGAAYLVFAGLYVVVAGFPKSPTRDFLTGVWYNDSPRIAALLPVAAVVLTAVGLDWAARALVSARVRSRALAMAVDGPRRLGGAGTAAYRAAVGLVLVVAAVALGQQGGFKEEVQLASSRYEIDDDSPLVSTDELALIHRLKDTVPADALLIGNPYTGAALSYALGDRKSAQLHIMSSVSPAVQKIYDSAGTITSDPSVCQAVREANAFYILDFGSKEVHRGYHTPPGLFRLAYNPGMELVDSEGRARLYKITACAS